jgi:hypothetical protein
MELKSRRFLGRKLNSICILHLRRHEYIKTGRAITTEHPSKKPIRGSTDTVIIFVSQQSQAHSQPVTATHNCCSTYSVISCPMKFETFLSRAINNKSRTRFAGHSDFQEIHRTGRLQGCRDETQSTVLFSPLLHARGALIRRCPVSVCALGTVSTL